MSEALAALTTLRVGGPARSLVTCRSEDEIVEAVRACDASGEPVRVVGGGSNLVVGDEGFPGTVVLVRSRGIEAEADDCAGAWVSVAAGEPWDDVVARAVAEVWGGLEALGGSPGLTGAPPIQTVGAYGAEVADTIARVRAYDRLSGEVTTLAAGDCGFGYRTSRFKSEAGRYVVLSVTFQLPLGSLSAPVRYAELADRLGIAVGERAPLALVREAVLDLRRGKGMVLDDADHDTWSVGSFFTNPVVDAGAAPEGAPQWAQPDGRVKVSAAWLVERAGFPRGFTLDGRAAVSGKHALALTNRGDASAADVLR
ncbi:MAG: UDP-N-acetylmuramate dehydrogenase, partial [bacterium]